MAEVLHLFVALVHRFPMREVEEVEAVVDKGLAGCIHGRAGSKRQVLLMDSETIELLGVRPGGVKENITTRGLDLGTLSPGCAVRIGSAVFEITVPCEPCSLMDEIRGGLQSELRGRRGWLMRVTGAGRLRRGDRIELLPPLQEESWKRERIESHR
jgi:MOSC domain-containing protein YiiM